MKDIEVNNSINAYVNLELALYFIFFLEHNGIIVALNRNSAELETSSEPKTCTTILFKKALVILCTFIGRKCNIHMNEWLDIE
jgi:hypothetical protein